MHTCNHQAVFFLCMSCFSLKNDESRFDVTSEEDAAAIRRGMLRTYVLELTMVDVRYDVLLQSRSAPQPIETSSQHPCGPTRLPLKQRMQPLSRIQGRLNDHSQCQTGVCPPARPHRHPRCTVAPQMQRGSGHSEEQSLFPWYLDQIESEVQ